MTGIRQTGRALALALLASCGEHLAPTPQPPRAEDILLSIDGIDITFGELRPYIDFLASIHPDTGRKTMVQVVLEQHVLPLRLAERAFPEERQRQRQIATDLRSVVTNIDELEAQQLSVRESKRYGRTQLPIPVAQFLFDPLTTGGLSQPIAVPRGFIVAGARDYLESPIVAHDLVDTTMAGFFTHGTRDWLLWLEAEQNRVADKLTYVHPDYREALPAWCKLP